MFYTPPSLFDPPTYPRKKLPLAGSPPEQAQPEPTAKVPYRPTEQASPRPPGNTIPLIFRPLAHPSLRRPNAAAAAYSDAFPALRSQTQPASAPAPFQSPAQPQQTPPTASPATQSTEEDPKAAAPESIYRDQSPTASAAPGQQLSTKPTDSTPQTPSQPPSTPAPAHSPAQPPQTPSTPSPAPQSTEEAPKVSAALKEAAAPQSPNTPAPPAPQSPSQSTTPPAPSQPPAAPPQAPPAPTPAPQRTEEMDPKAVDAVNKAAAQEEADTARQKRDAQLAELEANGMAEHAKALRVLDAEMAQRHADLEKKHPQHDAQYAASMRELEKEKEARQAPVMEKVQAFKRKERADNLRAAKIVASRESKLPATRGKTEEQKQAEWKAQMERVGLDPNNHDHVSAYWDAKRLHYLNDGRYAKYDWDGSTPKREGFGSAVLSDGSLHVAPEFIHNDKKYAAVVAASGASEAEKARAMADLPRLQQAYAEAMLPILKQAGSTRAAEWIPGIASFQKWQSEKPRQGSEAEQANEYLKEMNQRGVWSKGTDNVLRSLLAGFADMGTMGAGMAGMVGVPGASETAAEWSKRSSDFLAPISAEGGNSGTTSAIFGHVARMAGPMVATLLITRGLGGGIRTMSALSGAQTAGSQYAETYGRLREEGKTHAQAWLATAPFALASGLATAFLTAAGGTTGFEAALSTKAGTQTAKDAAQGFWKNLLLNVPKHALADIPQELPDELFSQMMSALATNHDADLGKVAADFIKNSPQLIGAIVLMGGAGGAMKTRQDARNSPEPTQADAPEDGKPLDETKQLPSSGQTIPDTTTDNKIPRFDEAFAASQTIEKLKAQKTPLSLKQQQELDTAEKTFAKRTEANILAQKATLEARGEKIHTTTAAKLAEVQATLARLAPPTTTTQSSSGTQPPKTTATTDGVAPPAGNSTSIPLGSTDGTQDDGGSHTTDSSAQPQDLIGKLIPESTTLPVQIDLARRRAENLEKIAAKRKLNPHEQDVYDNARRVRDRNSPPPSGSRSTPNPQDLVMVGGDGPISQSQSNTAEAPPPAAPALPANAIGSTINGPSIANPDAPTASADSPAPSPPTSPAGASQTAGTPAPASASPPSGSRPPLGVSSGTQPGTSNSGSAASTSPNNAKNKKANTTRRGVKRNNPKDWKDTMKLWDTVGYQDLLSPANRALIQKNLVPIVDDAWIDYHPEDAGLKGEKISIHHVQGLPLNIPLPYSRHKDGHRPGGFRHNPGNVGSQLPIYPAKQSPPPPSQPSKPPSH